MYGIEISGNDARILSCTGDWKHLQVSIVSPKLSIPVGDDSVESIMDFSKNVEMLLQKDKPQMVILCEGGSASKKKRIRMEYSVLCACKTNNIKYETCPSSTAARIINTGYKKVTNVTFSEDFAKFQIPSYYQKLMASIWRYLK